MIDYKTIISTTDSKVTLMQWLQALTEEFGDAKIKSVIFDASTTRLTLTIQKEDGTVFTTTQVLYSLTADEQALVNKLIMSVTASSDGVTFSKAVSFQGNESHSGSEIHNGYVSFLGDENHAGSEIHKGTATFTDLRSDDLTATDGQELLSWDGTTTALKGKADRPTYNGGDLALKSDVTQTNDIHIFAQSANGSYLLKELDLSGKNIYIHDERGTFTSISEICNELKAANVYYYGGKNVTALYMLCKDSSAKFTFNIDCTNVTSGQWAFRNYHGNLNLNLTNTSNVKSWLQAFIYCWAMTKIDAFDMSGATSIGNIIMGSQNIQQFLPYGMKVSFDLSPSTEFTASALRTVIDNCATITDGSSPTLTLGSTNLAKLTADDITTANNKGWNLA